MREVRKHGSPYPKADLTLRGLARALDLLLAMSVVVASPTLGPVFAAVYLLVADGLVNGQSIGKRLFGVRAVVVPDRPGARGWPAGYRESALRNAPFALVAVFYGVPVLWIVLVLAGIPIVAFESYMVWTDRLGLRIGDVFADTQVVDAKVMAKGEIPASGLGAAAPPSAGSSAAVSSSSARDAA
ncbi:MAG TPA: hypothetical protein VFK85_14790 [Anaeromyxobacteraceae bacterium]|nr:hypothetical protein [Anaeromyxobacteraceae bacterium]